MKGEMMPIKDLEKAREYKRLWIANKRKQKVEPKNNFVEPVEPASVEPKYVVEPRPVEPVEPQASVEPKVEPEKNVEPCQLNHTILTELFQQATIKIRQDYQAIYQDPETSRKCFNCHNLERNYQIMLNLLEKYWAKTKKAEKGELNM